MASIMNAHKRDERIQMITKAIEFTTEREYGNEAQSVVAWIIPGSESQDDLGPIMVIKFVDLTRNIAGLISFASELSKWQVMSSYDRGMYTPVTPPSKLEIESIRTLA